MSIVHVYEGAGTCPYVPMWRSEPTFRCLLLWLSALLFQDWVCRGTRSVPFHPGWPVSRLSWLLPKMSVLQELTVVPGFLHGCREFGLKTSCLYSNCSYPQAISTLSVRHWCLFNKRFQTISVSTGVCTFSQNPIQNAPKNVFTVDISLSCRSLYDCMEELR